MSDWLKDYIEQIKEIWAKLNKGQNYYWYQYIYPDHCFYFYHLQRWS